MSDVEAYFAHIEGPQKDELQRIRKALMY